MAGMSLRQLWLLVLIGISVLVVLVHAVIFSSLTDRYFDDYLQASYDEHLNQIVRYTSRVIEAEDYSVKHMRIELEAHLNDPITAIKLYDPSGELIIEVYDNETLSSTMMGGMMGGRMMDRIVKETSEFVNRIELTRDDELIGILNVTAHSLEESSFVSMRFKSALIGNSILSIVIGVIMAIIVAIFISKSMSKALLDTKTIAVDLQLGEVHSSKPSSIKEINAIRDTLFELGSRLKLKQTARKSAVDRIVHQVRTPLTVVKSHLEGINDAYIEPDNEEIQLLIERLETMETSIQSIGDVFEVDENDIKPTYENVDIKRTLEQIVNGLKPLFAKSNMILTLNHAYTNTDQSGKVVINSDNSLISQSVYNLLVNAYKYAGDGSHTNVVYKVEKKCLKIYVEDDGSGIDSNELSKIFDPYYRCQKHYHIQGDGLGLMIVKSNIEKLGGSVEVDSIIGKGSKFSLIIPLQ